MVISKLVLWPAAGSHVSVPSLQPCETHMSGDGITVPLLLECGLSLASFPLLTSCVAHIPMAITTAFHGLFRRPVSADQALGIAQCNYLFTH